MDCSSRLSAGFRRVAKPWVTRALGSTVLAVLLFVMAGCASTGRSDRPATVEDRGGQPQVPLVSSPRGAPATSPVTGSTGSEPEIAAYRPPAVPQYSRPEPNRAVGSLMRRAEDQRSQGDLAAAGVSLERALRIAPGDAELWSRLAALRLEQKRFATVPQLAAKSNALAAAQDSALKARNWQLIAESRRALGDSGGAREAQRRAATFR